RQLRSKIEYGIGRHKGDSAGTTVAVGAISSRAVHEIQIVVANPRREEFLLANRKHGVERVSVARMVEDPGRTIFVHDPRDEALRIARSEMQNPIAEVARERHVGPVARLEMTEHGFRKHGCQAHPRDAIMEVRTFDSRVDLDGGPSIEVE